MSSRAKAHIRNTPPVSAVVDGFSVRKGEIGYLIMMVTCLAEPLAKKVVLTAALLIGSLREFALGYQSLKSASFFY